MGLVIGSSQKALAYKIKSQLKYANPENIALELLKKQTTDLQVLGIYQEGKMQI